jgi:hypothetical protein
VKEKRVDVGEDGFETRRLLGVVELEVVGQFRGIGP